MNTVEKGNQFEKISLGIIEKLIGSGLFGIKEYLKVTPKAKIYSSLRKGDIEFDLMIEFCPPNSKKAMITYFIECKNYNKRIPVEQVQKFYSDIIQVSGVNVKGIFISNSTFQKSAYNYAESTGMMIIEADCIDNFKIVLHKRSSADDYRIPFIKERNNIDLLNEGLLLIEKMIDNQLLSGLIKASNNVSYGIDKLSKEDITRIAQNELNSLNKSYLKKAYGLDFKTVSDYLLKEYQVKIELFNPRKTNILGFCDIENKIIGINKSIIGTKRDLFVLGHEYGHYILHHKLYINQILLDSFSDSKFDLLTGKHRLENPRHWIEWQANYFSASFLIPRSSLMAKLWQAQIRYKLPQGNLYIDDQRHNQENFSKILSYLSYQFNVSKTSIIYRLKEFELLTDNSRTKRIGQIISEYKSNYFI